MKVCLIDFIFFFLPVLCLHKTIPIDTSVRKVGFSGTVLVKGLSSQQQFDRALFFFTQLHAAHFGGIEVGDPAQGVLKATGCVEKQKSTAASRNLYKTNFTLVLWLLRGAYRYELRDFSVVPFKKGRYCPEREQLFDIPDCPACNKPMEVKIKHKQNFYQEAERIAELVSSSFQHTLGKN